MPSLASFTLMTDLAGACRTEKRREPRNEWTFAAPRFQTGRVRRVRCAPIVDPVDSKDDLAAHSDGSIPSNTQVLGDRPLLLGPGWMMVSGPQTTPRPVYEWHVAMVGVAGGHQANLLPRNERIALFEQWIQRQYCWKVPAPWHRLIRIAFTLVNVWNARRRIVSDARAAVCSSILRRQKAYRETKASVRRHGVLAHSRIVVGRTARETGHRKTGVSYLDGKGRRVEPARTDGRSRRAVAIRLRDEELLRDMGHVPAVPCRQNAAVGRCGDCEDGPPVECLHPTAQRTSEVDRTVLGVGDRIRGRIEKPGAGITGGRKSNDETIVRCPVVRDARTVAHGPRAVIGPNGEMTNVSPTER